MKTTKVLSALVIGMMIVSSIPLFATAQSTSGELVIALQQDMTSMNPWDPDTNDVWKTFQIGWNFEGLMAYNPDYELYPVLAAPSATGPNGVDATITNGGMNISVNIRQGVTFHDGTALDSQDVVFSYQTLGWGLFQTQVLGPLYWDDGTTFTRYDGGVTKIGVQTNGTYRVDFCLNGNYAMFWYLTMAVPIMPHHIWTTHTIDMVPADYPAYNVTDEKSWDYSFGDDVTETTATIGTGPLMLQSWVKEQGSVIVPYTNYWDITGTTTWKSVNYPNYPQNVDKIRFKIYTQLDVAILALQNGDVHHLPWSLTPGYYNLLKTDPNIGIELNKDQGFFYMSYNFRKGAIADVNFRRAVAYCVDKQYIVDRLMGGYGIQGSVPMSVTNTYYVNTSVPAWIAGGDLNAAKALLDANGYTDKNSDGWRDMPDGSPLKYNILTPPKDYDPIRADAGIMIEKNLKSIGLNIAAVPTSFDTIVSAAYVSLDFDMYILGWSVGSFPESYLRDFFHGDSDVAMNPAGSNAAGYHNATVDGMIDAMEEEMDTEARVQLIKDICGATMMDVPYDVLYYRTNIEAYRKDIWSGWVPAFGTIYNGFSVFNLGATPSSGGGEGGESGGTAGYSDGAADKVAFNGTMALDAVMTMPDSVSTDSSFVATVMVNEFYENTTTHVKDTRACVGANVQFIADIGQFANKTTDANGRATFTVTVDWANYGSINVFANASKGTFFKTMSQDITVNFIPATATLSLSAEHAVIAPGGKTNVTAKVTDINGDPMAGVTVNVDNNLMFGWSSSNASATDAGGEVLFVYHAPPTSMLPNTNRYEQFKATITVPGTIIPEVQATSLIIGIQNSVRDWYSIDITGVTEYIITGNQSGTLPLTTDVTATVLNQAGTPVNGVEVTVEVDNAIATPDAAVKTTAGAGQVTFTLTAVDLGNNTQSTPVKVFNFTKAYSTSDMFLLCNANETNTTTGYAADIDFDAMVEHQGAGAISATVWDQTGAPAVGVPCQFFIPVMAEGIPAMIDGGDHWEWYEYGEDWDLNWLGSSYIGSWLGDNATVTDAFGQLNATFTTPSFIADSAIALEFGIGGYGVTESFNRTVNNFWMEYPGPGYATPPLTDDADVYYWEPADFTLKDSGILWRAPVAALANFEMDTPILSTKDPAGLFTMTFMDIGGPLAGAEVQLGLGTAKPPVIDDEVTDDDGIYTYMWDAVTAGYADFDGAQGFTATVTQADYSHFPFAFYVPYVAAGSEPSKLIVNASTTTPTLVYGGKANITAKITDDYGNNIVNATVIIGGTIVMSSATGVAQALIDIPKVEGLQAIPVVAFKSGYDGADQLVYVQVYDDELFLAIEYWNLSAPTVVTENVSFEIGFTAKNNGTVAGWTTFEFLVDGVVRETIYPSFTVGQTKNFEFAWTLTDVANHTFTVRQQNRRALSPWTLAAASDFDGDGIRDLIDTDDDNDGVLDTADAFPMDPTEWADLDDDGIGDNTDTDVDGDGVLNINDDFPWDADETVDTDGDGIGNNADTDDDGDGILDAEDTNPLAYDVPEAESAGYGIAIVAGAAIAMLVVGLLIGMIVAKMMAGKAAETAAPKPQPEPAEEPAEEVLEPEKPEE